MRSKANTVGGPLSICSKLRNRVIRNAQKRRELERNKERKKDKKNKRKAMVRAKIFVDFGVTIRMKHSRSLQSGPVFDQKRVRELERGKIISNKILVKLPWNRRKKVVVK